MFVRDGYVALKAAVPDALLEAALADLDRAYQGGIPDLRFTCRGLVTEAAPWRPEMLPRPAKALDIHYMSKPIRRLIFAPAICEFLALIFESKAFATQSLGFLRGSEDAVHQDTSYVPYTCATSFAASWIALEDVTEGGGELFYYPGSHRLPDFYYDKHYKSIHEASRINQSNDMSEQIAEKICWLERNAVEYGLKREIFRPGRGDVLIWHADLVHGGGPVSPSLTRKSIVTHYCPRHHAPTFAEMHQVDFHDHDGHAFTSSHYVGKPVLD